MKSIFKITIAAIALPLVIYAARAAAPPRPPTPATQPAAAKPPTNYSLLALWIAESNPPEYIFTLNNNIAYADINALERALAALPAGTTVTFTPIETVIGNEPLRDPDDLKAFQKFCDDHKLKLVVAPAK